MKITLWGINYCPEPTGIGPCTTLLARFLAAQGHEVHVVTSFPYYPTWVKQAEDQGALYRSEIIDGVRVHRCWHYVPLRVTAWRRIAHEFSFVLTSFFRCLALRRPDVFIVISPPLLLGAAGWLLSRCQRSRFLFHVQDLQPDAAASLGLIKKGLLLSALLTLEKFAYARADRISGISQAMLDVFRDKGVPANKLLLFPNPVGTPPSVPLRGQFRQRHNISVDTFLAVYAGNLGHKQGLETVVQAAARLTQDNVHVVLCGDGAMREHLVDLIRRSNAQRLTLLPLQSAEHYAQLMSDADVCLIPQQAGTGRFFFPSKLLSALVYGKPVLAVADADSELVRLMNDHGFGWHVPPGQPERLAETLNDAAGHRELLEWFAAAGRRFVAQFDPDRVLGQFAAQLEALDPTSTGQTPNFKAQTPIQTPNA